MAWPLGENVSDAVLEAALYRAAGTKTGHRRCPEPDWAAIHRELKRKHVTLQIVWDEYIAQHPEGYRYSRFCDLYRGWAAKLPVTMRQTHAAGDKLFVDYAGDKVAVVVDRGAASPPSCASLPALQRYRQELSGGPIASLPTKAWEGRTQASCSRSPLCCHGILSSIISRCRFGSGIARRRT